MFERIHEILWDQILAGEIVPGQRLKDIEWAKKLGVSRTPVREAMRKMQQEGILIALPQGGYDVRSADVGDFKKLYRCRASLEAQAAGEAANEHTAQGIRELRLIVMRSESALKKGDLDAAFTLNTEFHELIINLSDNPYLIGLCATIRRTIVFYRSALLNSVKSGIEDKAHYIERIHEKQIEHSRIVDAIDDGNASLASELMTGHLLTAKTHLDLFE